MNMTYTQMDYITSMDYWLDKIEVLMEPFFPYCFKAVISNIFTSTKCLRNCKSM